VQEPYHFYFPQLPQKQFYERSDFPWLDAIEAATDDIRAEWLAVASGDAFYLWQNGELNEDNAALCPQTMAALTNAPLAQIPGHSPSVLFSPMPAGTHVAPRNGPTNTRLQVHLPLVAPGKCRLRVGNDVREWQAGRAWVFDDSMEHEAWNDGDQARVVLQFDIARPEMTEDENRWVATLLEGVDAFPGQKFEWKI
jgi:aspartate beta-hydroxylase